MFTFGFFNSVKGDRKYNSTQVSQLFDGIIRDGVYMYYGNKFNVTPLTNMHVNVGSGRAWFNHIWCLNDGNTSLRIDPADVSQRRVDAVIIEIDSSDAVRSAFLKIKKGTLGGAKPSMTKGTYVNQYPLAYVTVEAGATSLTAANIQNVVGTEVDYVTSPLNTVSVSNLYSNWQSEWSQWFTSTKNSWSSWFSSTQSDWTTWFNQTKTNWTTWYNSTNTTWTNRLAAINKEWSDWFTSTKSSWTTWFNARGTEFNNFIISKTSAFNDFIAARTKEFNDWFNQIRNDVGDVLATTKTYTATIPTSGWTTSNNIKTVNVTVTGMLATDNPIVDVVLTGASTDKNLQEAWALIGRITTAKDYITVYCYGNSPTTAIPIQLKIVR